MTSVFLISAASFWHSMASFSEPADAQLAIIESLESVIPGDWEYCFNHIRSPIDYRCVVEVGISAKGTHLVLDPRLGPAEILPKTVELVRPLKLDHISNWVVA